MEVTRKKFLVSAIIYFDFCPLLTTQTGRVNAVDLLPLSRQVGMYIAFQRNACVRVSQKLTQCLDVTASNKAGRCKSMAKGVRADRTDPCGDQITADAFAVASRLHGLVLASG